MRIRLLEALVLAVLLSGCGRESGLRAEGANRFVAAPDGIAELDESFWLERAEELPFPVRLPAGRRIAAADWHADRGGALLTSASNNRHSAQSLYFVSLQGAFTEIPLPRSLKSPVNDVRLLSTDPALLVLGEAWATGMTLNRSLIDEIRSAPYHGDLLVTDLSGTIRRRHPSSHYAVPSPDSKWLAFWRSGSINGLHNLFVASPEGEPVFVCAITEADPGSGRTFITLWSKDSRFIRIHGYAYPAKSIDWGFEPSTGKLFEMPPLRGPRRPS